MTRLRVILAFALCAVTLTFAGGRIAAASPSVSHSFTPAAPAVGQLFDYALTIVAPVGDMVDVTVTFTFPAGLDSGFKLEDAQFGCSYNSTGVGSGGVVGGPKTVYVSVQGTQTAPTCIVTIHGAATPTRAGTFTIPVSGTVNGAAVSDTLTLTTAGLPATPAPRVGAAGAIAVSNCSGDLATAGSLPAAVATAVAGDTITFAQDCTDANVITLAETLNPKVNVTIDAATSTPPRAVTISGGSKVRLFTVNKGVALGISGLTLTGGNATCLGAMGNVNGNPVTTCPLSSGESDPYGGALLNTGGTVTISDSSFVNNTALYFGGAIYNTADGTVTISDSRFSVNTVGNSGGALYNLGGGMTISGSTFSGNVAGTDGYGGALLNTSGGRVTILNCTFNGNAGTYGGAVSNYRLFGPESTMAVSGSTFSGNRASKEAGAIYNNNARTFSLALSIVAGNAAPDGADVRGFIPTRGGNVIGVADGIEDFAPASDDRVGAAAAPLNPKLAPLADNGGKVQTFALLPGSPALDIAACPTDPTTGMPLAIDARGAPRPQGSRCDAGSYEAP